MCDRLELTGAVYFCEFVACPGHNGVVGEFHRSPALVVFDVTGFRGEICVEHDPSLGEGKMAGYFGNIMNFFKDGGVGVAVVVTSGRSTSAVSVGTPKSSQVSFTSP